MPVQGVHVGKVGDRSRLLDVTLKNPDGSVVDLSAGGTTVKLTMRNRATGAIKITSASCTIQAPATGGRVTYAWAAGDVDTEGEFEGEFVVAFAGSSAQEETFPADGTVPIIFRKRLA